MEAQDILSRLEEIESEKKQKEKQRDEKQQEKDQEKELFFKCKTKCTCSAVCSSRGLKQCPVYNEVKKSVCGIKAACQINRFEISNGHNNITKIKQFQKTT